MTRPVASSAGSALPFSTFGTSCRRAGLSRVVTRAQHARAARRRSVQAVRLPRRRTDQVVLTAPSTPPMKALLPAAVMVRNTHPSGLASMSDMAPRGASRAREPRRARGWGVVPIELCPSLPFGC